MVGLGSAMNVSEYSVETTVGFSIFLNILWMISHFIGILGRDRQGRKRTN